MMTTENHNYLFSGVTTVVVVFAHFHLRLTSLIADSDKLCPACSRGLV